jgi:serine/threonine protein kinase
MPTNDHPVSGGRAPRGLSDPEQPKATRCPRCGQYFTAEGRFCPFDAALLVRAEDWNPSDDPLLGSAIDDRYEVEALIGQGGVGSVYRVRHVRLGRAFALKALRRDLADDSEVRERFLREAKTASRVTHPGLVQISDFGYLSDGRPFFVMELLEGLSLRTVLESRGRLAPGRAAAIARRIAEALAAAHEAGIVHRDLKPDNVHIGADDGVKVVDFGLAIALDVGARRARSSVAFGTPHYMSPEQASGEPVDRRADVYALGIVLYEMLTGRVPFDAATHAEVLAQHHSAAPIPPSRVPGVDAQFGELEAVVLRCLAKRPDERFHTLPDLLAALDQAVPGLAAEPIPAESDAGVLTRRR